MILYNICGTSCGPRSASPSSPKGATYDAYLGDEMRQASVERQFTIVGEAMVRLRRDAPDLFGRITDVTKIVAFRNVLVHGYDVIDHDSVWDAVVTYLPILVNEVSALLNDIGDE